MEPTAGAWAAARVASAGPTDRGFLEAGVWAQRSHLCNGQAKQMAPYAHSTLWFVSKPEAWFPHSLLITSRAVSCLTE